jgi:hypothetical protein
VVNAFLRQEARTAKQDDLRFRPKEQQGGPEPSEPATADALIPLKLKLDGRRRASQGGLRYRTGSILGFQSGEHSFCLPAEWAGWPEGHVSFSTVGVASQGRKSDLPSVQGQHLDLHDQSLLPGRLTKRTALLRETNR